MRYIRAFYELYETLASGTKVEFILSVTMHIIYPVWQRWWELSNFNVLPFLIGTGFGSAFVANNNFLNVNELMNPNSSFIRLFYSNGIIGSYLFISAFLVPIRKLSFERRDYIKLTLMMLLLVGSFLGHRTTGLFIFLGIIIVVLQEKFKMQKIMA